jgi:hypothetical protein
VRAAAAKLSAAALTHTIMTLVGECSFKVCQRTCHIFKILPSFLERHTPRTRPRHCHPRLAQFTGIPRAFHAVTSTCAVALRNCGRAAPRAPEISQGFWHAARLERRFPFFIFLSSEAFGPIVA